MRKKYWNGWKSREPRAVRNCKTNASRESCFRTEKMQEKRNPLFRRIYIYIFSRKTEKLSGNEIEENFPPTAIYSKQPRHRCIVDEAMSGIAHRRYIVAK